MKRSVVGILAHVDAGKTTLSEALLYLSGNLRRLGRVDHGNAFLDTDSLERERGITIFSKQALLEDGELSVTLLDTPGHVDFSAEMERTLQVLDHAILVVSGTDGVQGHTRTLWRLLERYGVPVSLFVNKMDLAGADRPAVMAQLKERLSGGCVDLTLNEETLLDEMAMTDEAALEEFLETGTLSAATKRRLIKERKVFPCRFGSALKLEGVEEFWSSLKDSLTLPTYGDRFGARVFKISRDSKNNRLTWMKITGGSLKAKMLLTGSKDGDTWQQKADQLRLYSGEKFTPLEQADAGMVVAVTGLEHTCPGMGLGFEEDSPGAVLEPVLSYRLILPEGTDAHSFLPRLRQLEEEDPLLRIVWNEQLAQIQVRLMGKVQLEVLSRLIADRFGLRVSFDTGSVVYKETLAEPAYGIGHFEPLRHYAEVHLLLEPGPRGSGVRLATACSPDVLDTNWQRLIFTHLLERDHPGVLTGSHLTDVKITLIAGRAHLKHTEGGDFRQSTYRAVRQALMGAKCLLLEPFYEFRLELPQNCVGRAMTDLQEMGGRTDTPITQGEMTLLTGCGPVAGLQNYWQEVAAYTRGLGHLSCSLKGYEPCHNEEDVIAASGYDPERDVDNPASSVFCAHGAGFNVPWQQVRQYAHISTSFMATRPQPARRETSSAAGQGGYGGAVADKELLAIFERTYGKVERRGGFEPARGPARTTLKESYTIKDRATGPEYLLVDGYNIIFAWEDLRSLARQDLAAARAMLEDILMGYRSFRQVEVILVFDAYRVKGNPGSVEKKGGIYVVYTKEAETADVYIERTTSRLAKNSKVRVATSDGLEQVIILAHGALRLSAQSFRQEVEETQVRIRELIEEYNRKNPQKNRVADAARISREGDA